MKSSLLFLLTLPFLAQSFERPDGMILKAFFTPQDDIKQVLLDLIHDETQSISIMAYYITDRSIIQALENAAKNHIAIKIILDYWWLTHNQKRLTKLIKELSIHGYKSSNNGIMHNKFVIFNCNRHKRPFIWSGSFNFSHESQTRNNENIILSNDAQLIQQYQQIFNDAYQHAMPLEQIPFRSKKSKAVKIQVTERSSSPL